MADVIHDVTTIAELQARLILVDSKSTLKRGALAAVVAAVGLSILVGCIPVALLATTELLVIRAGMDRWLALTTSAGSGLVAAVILVVIGWWRLRRSAAALEPSKDELIRNLKWMKYVLTNRGGARPDPSFDHQSD